MEVHFTPELEAKVTQSAVQQGRNPDELVQEVVADRLWDQLTRLAAESYIADGTVFTFATRNAGLFASVLAAFSANAE